MGGDNASRWVENGSQSRWVSVGKAIVRPDKYIWGESWLGWILYSYEC